MSIQKHNFKSIENLLINFDKNNYLDDNDIYTYLLNNNNNSINNIDDNCNILEKEFNNIEEKWKKYTIKKDKNYTLYLFFKNLINI